MSFLQPDVTFNQLNMCEYDRFSCEAVLSHLEHLFLAGDRTYKGYLGYAIHQHDFFSSVCWHHGNSCTCDTPLENNCPSFLLGLSPSLFLMAEFKSSSTSSSMSRSCVEFSLNKAFTRSVRQLVYFNHLYRIDYPSAKDFFHLKQRVNWEKLMLKNAEACRETSAAMRRHHCNIGPWCEFQEEMCICCSQLRNFDDLILHDPFPPCPGCCPDVSADSTSLEVRSLPILNAIEAMFCHVPVFWFRATNTCFICMLDSKVCTSVIVVDYELPSAGKVGGLSARETVRVMTRRKVCIKGKERKKGLAYRPEEYVSNYKLSFPGKYISILESCLPYQMKEVAGLKELSLRVLMARKVLSPHANTVPFTSVEELAACYTQFGKNTPIPFSDPPSTISLRVEGQMYRLRKAFSIYRAIPESRRRLRKRYVRFWAKMC